MRYIFFGSGYSAKLVLENLLRKKIKPVLIITTPSKAKGRKQIISPNPIQLVAIKEKIAFLTPSNLRDRKFIDQLRYYQHSFQFAVLTDYGKIIPKEVLEIPQKGFLNLHPSLLPRWRGPTPIQSAIIQGDKITGVSIILMNEKIDQGPILAKTEFKIQNPEITYEELLKNLVNTGTDLLIKILPQWLNGKINPQFQNDSSAVYCRKFKKEDAEINWTKKAEEISNQIRALNPEPGTYTCFQMPNNKTRVICKILKTNYPAPRGGVSLIDVASYQPGEVFLTKDKKMAVKCGDEALILELIQPAGKKPMTAESFLRGNQWLIGKILK